MPLCGKFVNDSFGEIRIGLQGLVHVFERRAVSMGIDTVQSAGADTL
jgi:hypothetical protein